MLTARRLLLSLICLLPLLALFHLSDTGRLDVARSAMSAPDEFSYLLVADSLLHHHGISLQSGAGGGLGRDTFYPPGYPALLALIALPLGHLSAFLAHAANAAFLCLDTLLTYLLAKTLLILLPATHRRFQLPPKFIPWLALLIAALFATNWHVLEGALFVFSEPAFTAATLAWLLLALRNPDWPTSWRKALPIILLAIAAWAIRGAGITAVAATLLWILFRFTPSRKSLPALLLALLLPLAYQVTLSALSPEMSLAASAEKSANSYPKQLLNGLTHGHELSFTNPHDYPKLALRALDLAFSHLDDFSQAFTPIPRVPPDDAPLNFLGKFLASLALTALAISLALRRSLADLYLTLYIALYLIWPFNMPRFWTPILPLTLPYALFAALTLASTIRPHRQLVTAALLLLLALYLEELILHLPAYQRRLNYVSDSLASAAAAIQRASPDPSKTTVCVAGGDELFTFAWYFAHPEPIAAPPARPLIPVAPLPVDPTTGRGERLETFLTRELRSHPSPDRLYIMSYFTEGLFNEVFANLRSSDPTLFTQGAPHLIFKKEIIAQVWQWPAP